jgi:two-component system cell cycle response regulator
MDRATLTVLTGPDAGAVFSLESAEVVLGRGSDATLRFDEPTVSRRHAAIRCPGRGVYLIEDLDSLNGTYVGGVLTHSAPLRSGDRVQLGGACTLRFAIVDAQEEAAGRRSRELSTRDSLTAAGNRRCLFEKLASEISRARREKRALSVLLLDVDHFKVINDTFGHLAGDRVLCAMSVACSEALRAGDLFARYGGEEFAVVAREADLAEAIVLAERLRGVTRELPVEVGGGPISFTVSIGVASLSECPPDADALALVARADERLYAAKAAGRDAVCGADPPSSSA